MSMFLVVTTPVYILNINLDILRISYTFIIDFVIADKYTVGIIIKQEKKTFQILNQKHKCYISKHGIREGPCLCDKQDSGS